MFSRAVFIHNKIEREVEIILTPAASGPQCIGFPAINLTHQTAPFSPRMTYLGCYTIITSNSCSTLRFPLGVLHFIALHKCIILYICHYKFIQSNLTALKILRALPIHLPPPSPLQPLISQLFPQFCVFHTVMQLEAYKYVAFSDWLHSVRNMM